MIVKQSSKLASASVVVSLVGFLLSGIAHADKGVIALANGKCFVIDTPSGYVLVDGWVNVPKGTVVIGSFNTFGSVKIFDTNGNDVSGYIYIEDWGLSKSSVQEKWADKCAR